MSQSKAGTSLGQGDGCLGTSGGFSLWEDLARVPRTCLNSCYFVQKQRNLKVQC